VEWPLIGREADLDHALDLIDSGTGVAILGPAGVGKSRLLGEVVDLAQRRGLGVVHAIATDSTRSIPFAPFVELLPGGATQDRLAMLSAALSAVQSHRSDRGLVLAVDDAHELDDGSLALLIRSVTSRETTVCLTARSGEPMRADLVDLWTNGVIRRIDLAPLDREGSRSLVEATLGRADEDLDDELWRLAEGNPLVLHEIIEGAVGASIRCDDGVWTRTGQLTESARLTDLVTSRLLSLTEELRPAMDVVAVGSPLPLRLLTAAIGDAAGELEARGLLATIQRSGEMVAVVGHPLYGEILAANIGETRRQRAYRVLVESAIAIDDLSDPLRAAVWQRDCGYTLSLDLAVRGATEALIRHDAVLAESLVRPVGTGDDRLALLLGRALSYQQRFDEAEAILDGREPSDPGLSGEISSVRAQNLAFGLGRIGEARDLLEAAARRVDDDGARARINNERAMISAIRGDFVDARRATGDVLSDETSGDLACVAAYVTLTVAQAMTADVNGLNRIIDGALERAGRVRNDMPFAEDQLRIMQMQSLLNEGRIGTARKVARQALEAEDRGSVMKPTWLSASGLSLDLAGQLLQAAAAAREALDMYTEGDPFGLEAQTRGLLALAMGQMGDPGAAGPVEDLRLPVQAPRLAVWVDRGRAWAAVAQGRIAEAVETVVAAGKSAIDAEHLAWGAMCFHDAVRLGRADDVVERLRAIEFGSDARLFEQMVAHSERLYREDGEGLAKVAERFMGMGAWLLAAEAWAQAASLLDAAGRDEEAARAAGLSMAAAGRCEDPATPALQERPAMISDREMEVALDAVAGRTAPEIAAKRYISVRTVDNHLRSVYRKMGAHGRPELLRVLAPALSPERRDARPPGRQ
jgi:DNA-binding CsgD family transcriptional regulator/tetratricopeptide (TPR) repeat protein